MALAPIRVSPETRDDLQFLQRKLSAEYNKNYTLGDTVTALIHGHSPGNPKLAEFLRDVVSRRPVRGFPEILPHDEGTSYCTSLPDHPHTEKTGNTE